jgi:hypothetical protein
MLRLCCCRAEKFHKTRQTFSSFDVFMGDAPLNLEALIEGVTPLMLAVRSCNVKAATALINAGADPYHLCLPLGYNPNSKKASSSSQHNVPWTTPMHTAVERGLVSMVLQLLEADNDVVFMQSYKGFPPAVTLSKPPPPCNPKVHQRYQVRLAWPGLAAQGI